MRHGLTASQIVGASLQAFSDRWFAKQAKVRTVARRWGNPPARVQGTRERSRRIRQVLTGRLHVDADVHETMFEGVVLGALEARADR